MDLEKELTIGEKTFAEIAEWAKISETYLKKHKKAWCEKHLSQYAEYELIKGGVNILSVINPYYKSSARKDIKTNYKKYYGIPGFPVDTNTNCYRKMNAEKSYPIKKQTGINYIGEALREEFGIPYKGRKRRGTLGECYYIFCKIVNNEFQPFTEEEEKIKNRLYHKYFSIKEQDLCYLKGLTEDYKRNEITKEEYAEAVLEF